MFLMAIEYDPGNQAAPKLHFAVKLEASHKVEHMTTQQLVNDNGGCGNWVLRKSNGSQSYGLKMGMWRNVLVSGIFLHLARAPPVGPRGTNLGLMPRGTQGLPGNRYSY